MPTFLPDIIVKDQEGRPIAVVEIKNRENLSPKIAQSLRRNLAEHGYMPSTPFFLVLSQDVGYLWKDARPDDVDAPPNISFPLDSLVSRYTTGGARRHLSEIELEALIIQWLVELTVKQPKPSDEPEKTLIDAGFVDLIQGGSVLMEDAK